MLSLRQCRSRSHGTQPKISTIMDHSSCSAVLLLQELLKSASSAVSHAPFWRSCSSCSVQICRLAIRGWFCMRLSPVGSSLWPATLSGSGLLGQMRRLSLMLLSSTASACSVEIPSCLKWSDGDCFLPARNSRRRHHLWRMRREPQVVLLWAVDRDYVSEAGPWSTMPLLL